MLSSTRLICGEVVYRLPENFARGYEAKMMGRRGYMRSRLPEPDKNNPVPLSHLRFFWPFLRPYRRQIALAGLALLMVSGAMLSMGRGLAYLVDEGLASQNGDLLAEAVLITLGIALILAFGSYLRTSLVNYVGEAVMADIRRQLYRHVLSLSPSWFETARTGDILARLSSDTTVVQTVLASSFSMSVRNIILLCGGLILVVLSSTKMSLVVAVVVPLVVFPLLFMARRLRRAARLAQDRLADLNVQAEESLSGMRTIHAFGREADMVSRFNAVQDEALKAALSRVRLRGLLSAFVIFMVIGGIAVLIWIGGQDLAAGRISAGDLTSFIFYAFLVATSTGALSELGGDLQRAAGAAERIGQLFDAQSEIIQPSEPCSLPQDKQLDIQFDNVRFAYAARAELPALNDISLHIPAGQKIALVGPSGAGKSTLLHLLLRFYQPDAGQISIGGVDISQLGNSELKSIMALVPQEPALFSQSIGQNIRFGRPEADDDAVKAAAQQAAAHDFISSLPDGYDTMIGEKGVRLSGGQRQRLAIARAVLCDPQILLLDEATSALDSVSEADVQTALKELMKGRTSLVIAHRLSTVLDADHILVMDGGQIVATGTHESLLVSSPLYQELAQHQFQH